MEPGRNLWGGAPLVTAANMIVMAGTWKCWENSKIHLGVPPDGWFISWKIPFKWMIWGYPYFRKPPFGNCQFVSEHAYSLGLALQLSETPMCCFAFGMHLCASLIDAVFHFEFEVHLAVCRLGKGQLIFFPLVHPQYETLQHFLRRVTKILCIWFRHVQACLVHAFRATSRL